MQLTTLLLSGGLVPLAFAGYALRDDYSGNNFFNKFTFDTVRASSSRILVSVAG